MNSSSWFIADLTMQQVKDGASSLDVIEECLDMRSVQSTD